MGRFEAWKTNLQAPRLLQGQVVVRRMRVRNRSKRLMPKEMRFRTLILLLKPSVGPLLMKSKRKAFKISWDQLAKVAAHFSKCLMPEQWASSIQSIKAVR